MDPFVYIYIFFIGLLFGFLTGVVYIYRKFVSPLKRDKKSISVLHGKIMEQFAPFMKNYPYEPKKFRFIGSPIDGLQFNEDKILFVEFKTGNSKLSEEEKKIKELVEKKKVEWFEVKWE
ncbi:MAG: Holliday junction resolvase-like protein [Candidatus Thermoplasmatota archaeon]